MTRWSRFWSWLTDPEYRKQRGLVSPRLFVWRAVWFPFFVLSLLLFLVFIILMFGPGRASRAIEGIDI